MRKAAGRGRKRPAEDAPADGKGPVQQRLQRWFAAPRPGGADAASPAPAAAEPAIPVAASPPAERQAPPAGPGTAKADIFAGLRAPLPGQPSPSPADGLRAPLPLPVHSPLPSPALAAPGPPPEPSSGSRAPLPAQSPLPSPALAASPGPPPEPACGSRAPPPTQPPSLPSPALPASPTPAPEPLDADSPVSRRPLAEVQRPVAVAACKVERSGRFNRNPCGASLAQYNSAYRLRLDRLRAPAEAAARRADAAAAAVRAALARMEGGAPRPCDARGAEALAGVVFRDLGLRPKLLEVYQKSGKTGDPASAEERLSSADDVLYLEDRAVRVRLALPEAMAARLPTGLVVSVRGARQRDGTFRVRELHLPNACDMTLLPMRPLDAAEGRGHTLALLSGLSFGDASGLAARRRAVDFLSSGSAQHLVVCGGVLAPGLAGECLTGALEEADAHFAELAAALPVDVLPGKSDPTNLGLPQMPLNRRLFRRAQRADGFNLVSNPYECCVEGLRVMGHAGQPVQDMLRCTGIESPLEALKVSLEALHLAPTAPDTLVSQPFTEGDPFVIDSMPDVLFSGGHSEAALAWMAPREGVRGTLAVCVPDFRRCPAVVLISLRDPRDVRVHSLEPAASATA